MNIPKIPIIEFDPHLFRRVFHAFGASFLIFYLIPHDPWANLFKIIFATLLVSIAIIVEIFRIKGKINSEHFFGLRIYEKKRPASYLYFGVGLIILLFFFPQQIAIPCILCACLADPIIGEIRSKYGIKQTYLIGYITCFILFAVTCYKADLWIIILISLIGAFAALIGEAKKFWLIDDDFMIQILPAITLVAIWLILKTLGIDILPEILLHPTTI